MFSQGNSSNELHGPLRGGHKGQASQGLVRLGGLANGEALCDHPPPLRSRAAGWRFVMVWKLPVSGRFRVVVDYGQIILGEGFAPAVTAA
ncbi:MAG: hypothetical protein DRJ61_08690 [Acidobacteria bacterium]|nr:MAG: hypothetical protein DRJ61_08690 [Acidobacteriota bacterium]